jgi:drug/metabolite transporter (DMT)-like permease
MNIKRIPKPMFAFMLAFISVIFFSSKAVLVKVAYTYQIDALTLLTLRLLFALPVYIAVLMTTTSAKKFRKFSGFDYLKVTGLGFIGYYMASYLDFLGLKYISASLERLILFVYPTLVLLISGIFLKKKPSLEQKIAVLITYFGVMLAFFKNENVNIGKAGLGSVLIFGSALVYAIYLVGSGNLLPRFGTKLFTSLAMTVSTLSSVLHFLIAGNVSLWHYPKEVYLIALVMSLVCTVIPSFLLAEAIKLMGASNVAVIGSFGPISTIILAAIFLGEKITVFQMLGTVIVISGIMLIANGGFSLKKTQIAKKKT